jgi:hypothetical protein
MVAYRDWSSDVCSSDLEGVFVTMAKSRRQTIKCQVLATDAVSGVYQQRSVASSGEDAAEFAGLAESIYGDLNTLSWDGSLVLVEDECSGSIGVGMRVNLSGGPTGWAGMYALVQAVSEEVEAGRTVVELGVNRHLSAGQLVDLLRVNRSRNTLTITQNRSTGSGVEAQLPGNLAGANTTEGSRLKSESSVTGLDEDDRIGQVKLEGAEAGTNLPRVIIQRLGSAGAADATAGSILLELGRAFGKEIRLREAKVCYPDGEEALVMVLASEPYTESVLPGETPIGELEEE